MIAIAQRPGLDGPDVAATIASLLRDTITNTRIEHPLNLRCLAISPGGEIGCTVVLAVNGDQSHLGIQDTHSRVVKSAELSPQSLTVLEGEIERLLKRTCKEMPYRGWCVSLLDGTERVH